MPTSAADLAKQAALDRSGLASQGSIRNINSDNVAATGAGSVEPVKTSSTSALNSINASNDYIQDKLSDNGEGSIKKKTDALKQYVADATGFDSRVGEGGFNEAAAAARIAVRNTGKIVKEWEKRTDTIFERVSKKAGWPSSNQNDKQ